MTDLSPTAQAVLNAIKAVSPAPADEIAAVALRAVAEWVIPDNSGGNACCIDTCEAIHGDILAIATELESQ